MALAVDASTPTIKSAVSGTTVVSNPFSPPAGSVIYAYISIDQTTTPQTVLSLTDSLGSHLTWAKRTAISSNDTRGEIWWAYCPNAQTGMTVTANYSGTVPKSAISVIVFTGADSDQSTGAVGSAISASGTPSATLITTRDGSWVIGVVTDFSNNDTPTIPGGQTDVYNGNTLRFDYGGPGTEATWTQGNSATTATSGTSVTINDTAPAAVEFSMVIAEVLPALAAAAAAATARVRAFQEPDAFQPQGFQMPDATDAFVTPQQLPFQVNAFQRPDPVQAFSDQAFDDEGFQEAADAFQDRVFQGDAFQQDDLVRAVVGAFQDNAFDDEGFQETPEAFSDRAYQPDAFQIDEPLVFSTDLRPAGIPSAEAFGNSQVVRLEYPVGIASAESIGTARALRLEYPAGITTGETFGTPQAVRLERPAGIASAESFGTARALRLEYPAAIATAESFGTPRALRLEYPAGIASAESFGTVRALRLEYPAGIPSAESFGTARALRLEYPAGIATGETLGTEKSVRLLYPLGIPSAEAFGTHHLEGTAIGSDLHPTGIPSAEAFGTQKLVRLEYPAGTGSAESTGTQKAVRLEYPAGTGSAEAVGAEKSVRLLGHQGIGTSEAFGSRTLIADLILRGITSAETFGSHRLEGGVPVVVTTQPGGGFSPSSRRSPKGWSPPRLEPATPVDLTPLPRLLRLGAVGIASTQTVYLHTLTRRRNTRREDEELLLLVST